VNHYIHEMNSATRNLLTLAVETLDYCRHAIRQMHTNTTPNHIYTFHVISEQHEMSEPDFETNEFLHIK